jgi:flavodoxin
MMKVCTIFNSYSGNTRSVAERVHATCGGKLVEVTSKEYSSRITAYTIGCYRAMKGLSDSIEPSSIDVSSDDLIVIGTPVWAGRATPAINAAVAALSGCTGKKAVIFATCGGKARDTLPILKAALGEKGVTVTGEFVFDKKGVQDPGMVNEMIAAVRSAGSIP